MGPRDRGIRLKGVNRSGRWPSGNPRCYYRPAGQKGIPLPDLPMNDPGFLAAYIEAVGQRPDTSKGFATGTLGAAVRAYLASDAYLALGALTRANRRRIADKLCEEYGELRLAGLRSTHIRRDLAKLDPHPANTRLKLWRSLGRWWLDVGLIEADPAREVRPRATPKSDGFAAWSRDDLEAFRSRWPVGSSQRLAMEVMYQSCAAIGDACRLGPGNVRDGWLAYRRSKSGSEATCPWTAPSPSWFEPSPHLAACLDRAPLALTFLCTVQGRPRSPKAATQWFGRACRDAGLDEGKSAHGLRKLRASMFRENGASADQRMAILGHENEGQTHGYSRSADLQRVITGTGKSNSPNHCPTLGDKSLK